MPLVISPETVYYLRRFPDLARMTPQQLIDWATTYGIQSEGMSERIRYARGGITEGVGGRPLYVPPPAPAAPTEPERRALEALYRALEPVAPETYMPQARQLLEPEVRRGREALEAQWAARGRLGGGEYARLLSELMTEATPRATTALAMEMARSLGGQALQRGQLGAGLYGQEWQRRYGGEQLGFQEQRLYQSLLALEMQRQQQEAARELARMDIYGRMGWAPSGGGDAVPLGARPKRTLSPEYEQLLSVLAGRIAAPTAVAPMTAPPGGWRYVGVQPAQREAGELEVELGVTRAEEEARLLREQKLWELEETKKYTQPPALADEYNKLRAYIRKRSLTDPRGAFEYLAKARSRVTGEYLADQFPDLVSDFGRITGFGAGKVSADIKKYRRGVPMKELLGRKAVGRGRPLAVAEKRREEELPTGYVTEIHPKGKRVVRLMTPAEARKAKRAREQLMAIPEFVTRWATKLAGIPVTFVKPKKTEPRRR